MTDRHEKDPADPADPAGPELAEAPGVQRPFYGKPYWWLVFAISLTMIPIIGYMARAGLSWDEFHPALNALLNGTGAVFLVTGYVAIRRRNIVLHKQCMLSAVAFSVLFLASYLVRYAMSGSHHYPGTGLDKVIYLIILFSHMVLAALALPLVARTVYLGWRGRIESHRRIARITLPIWLYISVTGVIVYFMLYHLAEV